VQPPADAEPALLQRRGHRVYPFSSAALEGLLGPAALVGTCRIELCQGQLKPGGGSPRTWGRSPTFLADITDLINPPAPALRPLAVGPVGDEERTVMADNQVGRLEAVGVVRGAGGEVDLLERREGRAAALGPVADHRPAPLAEEQAP